MVIEGGKKPTRTQSVYVHPVAVWHAVRHTEADADPDRRYPRARSSIPTRTLSPRWKTLAIP